MHPWLALTLAGIFEIGFTTFLKLSANFTRWTYAALFLACASLSFSLLAFAMKSIPIGTAYAIWTGIGAAGTALVGFLVFKDPFSLGRAFFLTTLVGSIIGLKWVSS